MAELRRGQEVLRALVELAEPLWAGELEIVSTYFDAPQRTAKSDRAWLRRQCYKELWGSGVGDEELGLFQFHVARLTGIFERIDRGLSRHRVLAAIDELREEFQHYCLFADVHDSLGEPLDPGRLRPWGADDALARLRYRCRRRLGAAGEVAVRFTEGGCGTMYLAGMRLAGRGGHDEQIAAACERVYRDEEKHARVCADDLDHLDGEAARAVSEAVAAILRQRLHMRNEQFGFPVSAERLAAMEAGEIDSLHLATR